MKAIRKVIVLIVFMILAMPSVINAGTVGLVKNENRLDSTLNKNKAVITEIAYKSIDKLDKNINKVEYESSDVINNNNTDYEIYKLYK